MVMPTLDQLRGESDLLDAMCNVIQAAREFKDVYLTDEWGTDEMALEAQRVVRETLFDYLNRLPIL